MNICPECMGRKFIYSPGGYAPKLPCPICCPPAPPEAAHAFAQSLNYPDLEAA